MKPGKDVPMLHRACIPLLLLLLSACATTEPSHAEPPASNPRLANLQRVVAVTIEEALQAHERSASRERGRPNPQSRPAPTRDSSPSREPSPQASPLGRDWLPPGSSEPSERRPECTPRRVPPKGGHPGHNACADNIPFNAFRGANALVNGKAFDALQPATRTLWEVKTDNFDTYTEALQDIVIGTQVGKLRLERDLARACGFDFRVGVRSPAHKEALEDEAPDLRGLIVVMNWC